MRFSFAIVIGVICSVGLADVVAAPNGAPVLPKLASGSAHGVGWVSFSKYKPKEVKRLAELPTGVRRRLQEHLVDRLNENFYRKFSFTGGQVVDWEEFRRVEPNPGYKWKVFTYNLMFELRDPEAGIAHYGAAVELDAKGDIIRWIGFPPARRLPHKGKLVPLARAYAIAKRIRFDPSKTRADLTYDEEIESIVFRLTQTFRRDDGGRDHVIDVDAHSGRLLRNRWETWYRHH